MLGAGVESALDNAPSWARPPLLDFFVRSNGFTSPDDWVGVFVPWKGEVGLMPSAVKAPRRLPPSTVPNEVRRGRLMNVLCGAFIVGSPECEWDCCRLWPDVPLEAWPAPACGC